MTVLALREYQVTAIEQIRAQFRAGRKRVLLRAPTGSGKTVLTAHMMREARERGKSSWFLVHRKELLEQTSKALWMLKVPHGSIIAGRRMTPEPVQVASVQTLVRRLDKLSPPDMIIVDEAHHAAAKTYRNILDHANGSWLIGLTATPARTDGEGLSDLFEVIVHGPELDTLIRQGYLSPYRIIAPTSKLDLSKVHIKRGDYVTEEVEAIIDQATVIGDAVEHYRKYISPRTCLVYCVSRRHARHVTEYYRAAGHDAAYVAGDTPREERNQAIEGFRQGSPAIIVSVDLFGEGLDVPGLAAVQLLRPTQSLILHLQQIGRALRVEEGKEAAVVLDHVGNTWRHGLPDDEREWTLEGQKKRRGRNEGEAEIHLRHCQACLCIYPATLPACPNCGEPASTQGRMPEAQDGELREIEAEEHRKLRRKQKYQQGRARTLEELVEVALDQGKKPAWAAVVYASRTGAPKWKYISEARKIADARKAV